MGYIGAGISRFNTADELTVTGDAQIDTTTLVVDSTNNRVGILNGSPTTALDVTGTVTADGIDIQGDGTISGGSRLTISDIADVNNDGIRLDDSTTSRFNNLTQDSSGNFKIQHWTGSAWQNNLTLTTGGNLGIGTASPEDFGGGYTTLEVAGSTTANGGVFKTATSDSAGTGTAGTEMLMYSNNGGGVIAVTSSDPLLFQTAGAERMRLDSNGNLLVGKTASGIANNGIELRANDDVLITKDGATALYLNRKSSDGEIIEFRKDGTGIGAIGVVNNNNPYISNDADNSGLQFASTSILPHYDDLQRDNAVDLGSSTARFKDGYFNGTLYAGRFAGKSDTDTFIDFQGSNVMQFFTANSERLRIMSDGRIGKGRTSAIQGEDISHEYNSNNGAGLLMHSTDTSGNTHSQVIFRRNGSNVGSIQTSGSATSYNTSSDRRLKSNIEDAASASDKIDAIQVRQFDWNADDSHQDYGLIAQELQPIEPLAVSGDADSDEMMAVDYSKLVPMLIKEIQELRSRVAALEE